MAKYSFDVPTFEFEVYWGTPRGVLLHDTIEVEAADYAEAETVVYRDMPTPRPGFEACAGRVYFSDHYDAEFLGELKAQRKA